MKIRWLVLLVLALFPRVVLAQTPPTDDAGVVPPPPTTTETPPPPPPPPPVQSAGATTSPKDASPLVQITSLKILLDKKIISREEYDAALHDMMDTSGSKGGTDINTFTVGKFATTIYGFVEADAIHDSTQGFNDLQGTANVARNETFAGRYGQLIGSIRNSRLGVRIKAPEVAGIRVSGQLEMDFLGNQPAVAYPNANGAISEQSFFANAAFRERHINVKIETPVLDFLFGQYWALFGWQPYFHSNTDDMQGVPLEVYSRRPQIRISKTVKTDPVNFEIAVAALNPIQRASEAPQMQAGLRLAINKLKAKVTHGATGTDVQPAMIGVSGDMKYVKIPTLGGNNTADLVGTSLAVSALVPVIPASDGGKSGNNLTLTGEFETGYGMNDQFTGFTGGVGFPATYTQQNIDNGIVSIDATGAPHYIQWYAGSVGLQYYLPVPDGKVWIAVNYAHGESPNIAAFGAAAKVVNNINWVNADIFAELVPGFRLGLSYGRLWDDYADKQEAINDRVMGSAFFIF